MLEDLSRLVALDLEVYPNYTLFAFMRYDNRKVIRIEIKGSDNSLSQDDIVKMSRLMRSQVTFGYNSNKFDIPLIMYALGGATASEIFTLGSRIIDEDLFPWQISKLYNIEKPNSYRHFDVSEPSPSVRISLKLFMGRMHSKKLQDLPIAVGTMLTSKQMQEVADYCTNDLTGTVELFENMKTDMQLRDSMSTTYGIDFMSKSDAQVAEAIILANVQGKIKRNVQKVTTLPKQVEYVPPKYIKFQTEQLQQLLDIVRNHKFTVDQKTGKVKLPAKVSKHKIQFGSTEYQIGIGGLHSKEKGQVVLATDDMLLIDRDVTSYYPFIIRTLRLFPKQMGEAFLEIYSNIIDERVEAKGEIKTWVKVVTDCEKQGDTDSPRYHEALEKIHYFETKAGMLKICVNGSFGKFGSKYSKLYSPDLMLAVTLTGQLALLMLIETLELDGIHVVSGNTDGFVSHVPKDMYDSYVATCLDWELRTGFTLEETQYSGLYSRNVNNYFAVTTDGKIKGKGIFAKDDLRKNPNMPVVSRAVEEYLVNGTPFMQTLKECKRFTDFLVVRTVKGGAVYEGEKLGRVVRWAYTTDGKKITYESNGNLVPKSTGGKPFQDLPDAIPENLDWQRYIYECMNLCNAVTEFTPSMLKFQSDDYLAYQLMLKKKGDVDFDLDLDDESGSVDYA